MKKGQQKKILELLKRSTNIVESGDDLPKEWARELFPPERREYELMYYDKKTEEQILADTMALPLQKVNTFGKNGTDWHNKLIFGDNLQAMKNLLKMKERGELVNADGTYGVKLVYIDPPFATKQDFKGNQEQKAYRDKIVGAQFLEFLRERLVIIKELLSDDGSIYLHLDQKKGHYAKVLMDEIFGEQNLVNEIIYHYQTSSGKSSKKFIKNHDSIYFYVKNKSQYQFNQIREPWPEKTLKKWQKDEDGRIYRVQNKFDKKYYIDPRGKKIDDVWGITLSSRTKERIDYPTQKPELLLERIIIASSKKEDIVLDAFAGSGTTCSVAEKLKRRWIAIDAGKLAIYTIQKRMLNLRKEIGNKGAKLKVKPFTLYNAGLYDFDSLKDLSWKDWRFFALQLFECRDEEHEVRKFKMDGYRYGSSVLVFDHTDNKTIDQETIKDIHSNIGKHLAGDRCFIIAPRGTFLFQEDFIEIDDVKYYALRIPYSYIQEIHKKEFAPSFQPNDETAVNEIIEAVGFDFIQPPKAEFDLKILKKDNGLVSCKIKKFESRARLRGKEKVSNHEALSMVMIDYDYKDNVFDLDKVFYAQELKDNAWKIEFSVSEIIGDVMLVFLDIYGNESRQILLKKNLIRTK